MPQIKEPIELIDDSGRKWQGECYWHDSRTLVLEFNDPLVFTYELHFAIKQQSEPLPITVKRKGGGYEFL